jgi:mannose-6-phosphate isomerase-like protein (cupin superfamily)
MRKTACGALAVLAVASPLALGADWIGPATDGKSSRARDLAAELAAQPLGSAENVKPLLLHRGERTSHLLVQIRDREPVHYHADSDITVLMLRGSGTIHIGEQKLPARAGDVMFIPRRAVHYFINEAQEPAAALVIYSPPPGPNDRVLVPQPAPR